MPSLGVGSTGHILAAWSKVDQHIAVEFAVVRTCQTEIISRDTVIRSASSMIQVRIPIYSGHLFRREAGRRYDLMSATIPE